MHKLTTSLALTMTLGLNASGALSEPAEISLIDRLDGNLDSYCLDIRGSQANANVAGGLQTHTCYAYQGQLGIDQIFDTDQLAAGTLYMPEFDVCATLSSTETGATVGLDSCDGSSKQSFVISEAGAISPSDAPQMCLTAGADTSLGRGGTSEHQIKSLTLQPCSEELQPYQLWQPRPFN